MGDAIDGGLINQRFGYKSKTIYSRCFAWLPLRCKDGRWHWLKPMYCKSITKAWTTNEYGGYPVARTFMTPRQFMFYKLTND